MSDRLPVQIDPLGLAQREGEIQGHIPVAVFRRLAAFLTDTEGQIEADLVFGRDGHDRPVVRGHLQGTLMLTCQRCLAPMALPLDQPFELVLVASEAEAKLLPETLDAVVTGDTKQMHTVDLLEDELILALPLIARCPDESQCRPAVPLLDSAVLTGDQEEPGD